MTRSSRAMVSGVTKQMHPHGPSHSMKRIVVEGLSSVAATFNVSAEGGQAYVASDESSYGLAEADAVATRY